MRCLYVYLAYLKNLKLTAVSNAGGPEAVNRNRLQVSGPSLLQGSKVLSTLRWYASDCVNRRRVIHNCRARASVEMSFITHAAAKNTNATYFAYQRRRAIETLEARAPPQYCDCGPDWPLLFKVHEI